jgi:hypothetical protein
MANYHVTKGPDGWRAKREGAGRAASQHRTQAEAQREATRLARGSGGGEVKIHKPTGPIRNSNTIGKPDPNPPKDRRH